jgi:hypothetical protein
VFDVIESTDSFTDNLCNRIWIGHARSDTMLTSYYDVDGSWHFALASVSSGTESKPRGFDVRDHDRIGKSMLAPSPTNRSNLMLAPSVTDHPSGRIRASSAEACLWVFTTFAGDEESRVHRHLHWQQDFVTLA